MVDDLYVFDYPLDSNEIRPLVLKGQNVAPDVQLASDQVKVIQPNKEVTLSGTVEIANSVMAGLLLDNADRQEQTGFCQSMRQGKDDQSAHRGIARRAGRQCSQQGEEKEQVTELGNRRVGGE